MSNLQGRTLDESVEVDRHMHAAPVQPARPRELSAREVYGNTFGMPFAVWWTIAMTILVFVGVWLDPFLHG